MNLNRRELGDGRPFATDTPVYATAGDYPASALRCCLESHFINDKLQHVGSLYRDALVLVLAADHIIRKPHEFHEACRSAATTAAEGRILTFRIEPTHSARLRRGKKLNGHSICAVDAFVEKPDATTATRYVAEGYLWNSGNFLFHAATMLREIEQFEPGDG